MPSRKKDRGKQRKAAKQYDSVVVAGSPPTGLVELLAEGCRIIRGDDGSTRIRHPCFKHIRGNTGVPSVSAVRNFDRGLLNEEERQELAENFVRSFGGGLWEGNYCGTDIIVRNVADPHIGPQMGAELAKANIHLQLLRFLKQSDKPVSSVVRREVHADESTKLPYYWVMFIGMIVHNGFPDGTRDDVQLTLAKGIEPFVMSMIDNKRELFQSNLTWHVCLPPFFQLARCIMESKEAFLVMISYEGFLPFVAQASCWSQSREDLVDECRVLRQRHRSESDNCPAPFSKVCFEAQKAIGLIFLRHDGVVGGTEMKGALDQIACTPLLSNDPECNDSTMVGLIRMLDECSDSGFLFECIIQPLLLTYECIDARVIAELIDFGKGNRSMEADETVLNVMVSILGLNNKNYEHIKMIDSRYAAAIRHGLLEFCIDALVAYGDESDCEIAARSFLLVDGLHRMAMHSKMSRALRERKAEITTALDALRKKSVSRATAEICSLIDVAVDMSAPAICCNCLKEVDRKELLFCKRCGVECYCSPTCQSESYALGHEELCREEVQNSSRLLEEEVLSGTKLKRLELLRRNLMMNGCRIVQRNAAEFLNDEGNIVLVRIDFGVCPPGIEVARDETGDRALSGILECVFVVPVHYGFAEKVGLEEVVLEKVISRRSLDAVGSIKAVGQ